jgi:hypothetical protein
MRSASLMGRAFGLRDGGRLEEALAACNEALAAAQDPRAGGDNTSSFSTIVVGALTVDEIATRLGTPELARKPLENAVRMFELLKRRSVRQLRPDKYAQLLIDKEQEVRRRLEQLGPGAR